MRSMLRQFLSPWWYAILATALVVALIIVGVLIPTYDAGGPDLSDIGVV